ncbi:MAG: hypothetical protein HYW05_03195 [Candidatus Diapherotrites archaeon]|nr:hypothetical protein [Candidatus Diapherotrites archaeon]
MSRNFDDVAKLIDKMLSKKGDVADRSLSLSAEADNLIEEAREVKQETLRRRIDAKCLKEEIGDVLWDVILLSKISEKKKLFTLDEMLKALKIKIKKRNPHVFGKEKANSLEEAVEAKRRAKKEWKAEQ